MFFYEMVIDVCFAAASTAAPKCPMCPGAEVVGEGAVEPKKAWMCDG